jgi:hypothetical protein
MIFFFAGVSALWVQGEVPPIPRPGGAYTQIEMITRAPSADGTSPRSPIFFGDIFTPPPPRLRQGKKWPDRGPLSRPSEDLVTCKSRGWHHGAAGPHQPRLSGTEEYGRLLPRNSGFIFVDRAVVGPFHTHEQTATPPIRTTEHDGRHDFLGV